MNKEDFPRARKGDILTDGRYCYLYLGRHKQRYGTIHGYSYWSEGFLYLDAFGRTHHQDFSSGEYKIIGHTDIVRNFLKALKKELKDYNDKLPKNPAKSEFVESEIDDDFIRFL